MILMNAFALINAHSHSFDIVSIPDIHSSDTVDQDMT